VPLRDAPLSEKLPWAATPAPHRFEKFPALDDYTRDAGQNWYDAPTV
jgi:hypothetical protein